MFSAAETMSCRVLTHRPEDRCQRKTYTDATRDTGLMIKEEVIRDGRVDERKLTWPPKRERWPRPPWEQRRRSRCVHQCSGAGDQWLPAGKHNLAVWFHCDRCDAICLFSAILRWLSMGRPSPEGTLMQHLDQISNYANMHCHWYYYK